MMEAVFVHDPEGIRQLKHKGIELSLVLPSFCHHRGLHSVLADPDVSRWIGEGTAASVETCAAIVQQAMSEWSKPAGSRSSFLWIMMVNHFVGGALRIHRFHSPEISTYSNESQEWKKEPHQIHDKWVVTAAVHPAFQGYGVGANAVKICASAFSVMPEGRGQRLYAVPSQANHRARRAFLAAGFCEAKFRAKIGKKSYRCKILVRPTAEEAKEDKIRGFITTAIPRVIVAGGAPGEASRTPSSPPAGEG